MNRTSIKCQEAMDYALYMITSSYFESAICKRSRFLEERLRLYYKEQSFQAQYLMEEACITFVENILHSNFSKSIWNKKAEVRFLKEEDSKAYTICFVGEKDCLAVKAELQRRGNILLTGKYLHLGGKLQSVIATASEKNPTLVKQKVKTPGKAVMTSITA